MTICEGSNVCECPLLMVKLIKQTEQKCLRDGEINWINAVLGCARVRRFFNLYRFPFHGILVGVHAGPVAAGRKRARACKWLWQTDLLAMCIVHLHNNFQITKRKTYLLISVLVVFISARRCGYYSTVLHSTCCYFKFQLLLPQPIPTTGNVTNAEVNSWKCVCYRNVSLRRLPWVLRAFVLFVSLISLSLALSVSPSQQSFHVGSNVSIISPPANLKMPHTVNVNWLCHQYVCCM